MRRRTLFSAVTGQDDIVNRKEGEELK